MMCLSEVFKEISLTLILIQNISGYTKLNLLQKQSLLSKINLSVVLVC